MTKENSKEFKITSELEKKLKSALKEFNQDPNTLETRNMISMKLGEILKESIGDNEWRPKVKTQMTYDGSILVTVFNVKKKYLKLLLKGESVKAQLNV